jgi:AcrR family transcriptional regulator
MPISEKTRSAYHHGDLRNAMITVARRALNEGNYEALSLREIARLAGVSANAPYRNFASKQILLAEIAASGFSELTSNFDAECTRDPVKRLARLCDVYN